MFTSRKPLRSLARLMLALWLCVLSLGAAHACVVAHQLHAAAAAVPCPAHPAEHEAGPAADVGEELALSHAAQLACESFCDAEATGTPSGASSLQQAAAASVVWLAPPPTSLLAPQALHAPTAATWPGQPLARTRVPVAIAFLRLTL